MLEQTDYVLAKLDWMREQRIWPNGLRYLWTDAFGVVLLVSLYRKLGGEDWLDQAEELANTIGTKRPSSITTPSAVLNHGVFAVSPAKAEPLLFAALVKA